MRARLFLVMCVLTGCGIISGLDGLGVDDDASTDATATDSGANDSGNAETTPQDSASDAPIPLNVGVLCGSNTCTTPEHCCFAKAGIPMCSTTDCPTGDTRFNCDNHNDCSVGSTCCLANNVATCTLSTLCDGSVLCIVDASPSGCGGSSGACKPLLNELPTTGACN